MDTIVDYDCFTIHPNNGSTIKMLYVNSTIPSASNARAAICSMGSNTAISEAKNSAIVAHGFSYLVNQPGRIYVQYTKVEE